MRMKPVWALFLAIYLLASPAGAQTIRTDYPACDLMAQRELVGSVGAEIMDPQQAHIAERANILQADIGTARRARRISQRLADRLWRKVEAVRTNTNPLKRNQTFLGAAERTSYDRQLDSIAGTLCR